MQTARLILNIKTASGSLTAGNCEVVVSDPNGTLVARQTVTPAEGGISDIIELPAPEEKFSLDSDYTSYPYSTCNITIDGENYYKLDVRSVQLFAGILSVLPVKMVPLPADTSKSETLSPVNVVIPPHSLTRLNTPGVSQARPSRAARPAVNILGGVFIPENITVHLGEPAQEASNVTVSFTDYIKNVASSEIYPTWPKASLRANIIAQISLALNRVYTEWYRQQGYPFDITNSTDYDQYFVYGRNIFEDISLLVDDIFNTYIRKRGAVEPYFAEYCNGTFSTCPGMSQWGTVALAENGLTYEDILRFYYGDIETVSTDVIQPITGSYPGEPLTIGSSGENVRVIQEQLNRIAINFPAIPLINVNSVYGETTANAVRKFQELELLPEDGIVGKATWYRISYVYTAVKKLGELTSEGQRASYNLREYPGYELRLNSKGSEIQEIQFYLSRIHLFNPAVLSVVIDGIYGKGTETAVLGFQRIYGLPQTGIVDENTWDTIVRVYLGTIENVEQPSYIENLREFPGTTLVRGSNGGDVEYVQELLNIISEVFVQIPKLAMDGIYGSQTESAVRIFTSLFMPPQKTTVDKAVWDRINEIYTAIATGCIFASMEATGTLPYPNVEFRVGSTGDYVTYIQNKLNTLNRAIPAVPIVDPDGSYGTQTQNSVRIAQGIFGLTQSGTVNRDTWNLLNYLFVAIQGGCLKSYNTSASLVFSLWDTADEVMEIKKKLFEKALENDKNKRLYGKDVVNAVKAFQRMNHLNVTGKLDEETRKKLFD